MKIMDTPIQTLSEKFCLIPKLRALKTVMATLVSADEYEDTADTIFPDIQCCQRRILRLRTIFFAGETGPMSKKTMAAILLVMTLIAISSLMGCRTNVDYPYSVGRIKGTVTDSLGTPVADVSIDVSGKDERAVSDLNGRYELDLVPTGEIVVIASRKSYKSAMTVVNVPVGEVLSSVNFVLRKE
ncbi:MAG: hypothetical protein CVV64_14445 [Candidatus Wallbacteria bacterium HGW-Wallbacteria-1]|jgi:hypothetical protein|uniref:Carboxypeptidase regulatory-like domain-containing protein n=1 Tax=Candidatus Wallbacteria bacterium HGW-Wallbacteria-1 TaxID=2013854 RepID=A0A2N1PMB1_9BACT|nr:MAG: hypothetical protein CVV64_14445 [Candidatus Wallbacteria bacterium HGW-Wallbacteria-1]